MGLLKGRLISISSVPETINQTEIGYIGEVAFPQGMVSSYKNKSVLFSKWMERQKLSRKGHPSDRTLHSTHRIFV